MKERTLKIFRKLVKSDIPISLESLCSKYKVSSRTIRNEIAEINIYLESNNYPAIQSVRGQGYHLSLSNDERGMLNSAEEQHKGFVNYTQEERILDLVLSFSLGKESVFLNQKEQEYEISKSSMDGDIRRVRELLKQYGIEVISMTKQGIVLQGAERSIRTMVYDIINRSVGIGSYPRSFAEDTIGESILYKYISKEMLKKLNQIYDEMISSTEENIYREEMILFTAVCFCRYLRQDIISSTSWESVGAPQNDIKRFVQKVCEAFSVQPPEIEIKYIVFMLDTLSSKDMFTSVEWVQAQMLSIQMIQHVERETKIPFSRKEESLLEGIYKHMVGLINRVKGDIQITNPLKENIQHHFGNIYNAVQSFASVIERTVGKSIIDDEIAFLTIHFSVSVSAINQDLDYVYKAVVICNHGVATGNLLAENLKEHFAIDVIAVLSSREIELVDKLDIDVIFSTLEIESMSKPVLVLDPIIKAENIGMIDTFLEKYQNCKRLVNNNHDSTRLFHSIIEIIEESEGKISKEIYHKLEEAFDVNHLRINKREIQPMLKDALKDSNILLNEEVKDWREAIRRVSIPLIKEDAIEKRYIDAMIHSVEEFGPYIVIGKHLALAHARPEDGSKKLGVSVATLKEPVAFGNEDNDPVKIIFCLSAIDSYSHLKIMRNLIDLINDEQKIEKLSECNEMEGFKKVLFEEKNTEKGMES